MKRHFPYKHPTFGTKSKPKSERAWKSSVYYWWWEYLRRNEDYKRSCLNGGKGKCAKLYDDFGDVFTVDFKTWWSEGGRAVHLFAEPAQPSIQLLEDAAPFDTTSKESLVLAVPLNLPINFLCAAFRKIVSKHHTGKRGVRANQASQARYKVSGKVDLNFLEAALKVWDYRQANPDVPLWKLAQDVRLVEAKRWVQAKDTHFESADKRNVMTATASRHFRKAAAMIKNVGTGQFPASSLQNR
jgi:hypothetical protein